MSTGMQARAPPVPLIRISAFPLMMTPCTRAPLCLGASFTPSAQASVDGHYSPAVPHRTQHRVFLEAGRVRIDPSFVGLCQNRKNGVFHLSLNNNIWENLKLRHGLRPASYGCLHQPLRIRFPRMPSPTPPPPSKSPLPVIRNGYLL